nr:unnamed protein product [Callosobruchus analis]
MGYHRSGSDSDTDTGNSDSSTSSPSSQPSSDVDEAKNTGSGPNPTKKNCGTRNNWKASCPLEQLFVSRCGQGNMEEAPGVILHSGQLHKAAGPMLNCAVPTMLSSAELKKDLF